MENILGDLTQNLVWAILWFSAGYVTRCLHEALAGTIAKSHRDK